MDRFSPVAPAQIRVLVLPVGSIERSRYLAFLDRLKNEGSIVRLAELEPYDGDNNDVLLSPKTFLAGSLLYNYTVSTPSEQQQHLSPFELFREPLLVLGVKDGLSDDEDENQKEVRIAAELLRERHPRVVHRQVIVLQDGDTGSATLSDNIIRVRNVLHPHEPSLRVAVCQISAGFLVALATYVQAMQASPTIQTPGQTARSLQRTASWKERERQSAVDHKTPPQSMELTRTIDPADEGRSNSAPISRSPPPNSFDQMPRTNGGSSRPTRPDSRGSDKAKSSVRASSQDRVSVQGFGSVSATSQEKMKTKGQARVGIVVGFLYLMAGHWDEAMRLFVHHTTKIRALSDHIWHGKGLEGTIVCMLLHAWAGLEFHIPQNCFPVSEKPTSTNGQRFSVDIPSQFRSGDARQSSTSQLSNFLPDLVKFILNLYHSGEGSLELPFVSVADATVRFCKLLATLHSSGGELNSVTLESFTNVRPLRDSSTEPRPSISPSLSPHKSTTVDIISYADPSSEENISIADHAAILAGTASVYALLRMHRKKAITIKDLLVKLTGALIQARKKGAAEIGIHPAASLSADAGENTVFSIAEDCGGLSQMMSEVASVYGISLDESSTSDRATDVSSYLGSDSLKLSFMKALATFCEASPDPLGVMRVNASMFRAFGPSAAVDAEPPLTHSTSLSKDEQVRCITAINRTLGVSKLLHLPRIQAEYWDDFLIREVEFIPAEPGQAVADLSKLKRGQALEQTPGNPLLYDPHANRPRTADEIQQTNILVPNEVSTCRVTLQNPYEVSVDVESIKLVTEGVELNTSHQRFTLSPSGIQRVSLSIFAGSPGDCKVTGCLVKIQGCRERIFPIVSKPWCRFAPVLLKQPVYDRESPADSSKDEQGRPGPERKTVAVTVIEPQPILGIDDSSIIESTLMLLDGEIFELKLAIRNNSDITASIFDIVTTNDAIQLQADGPDGENDEFSSEASTPNEPTIVKPGESAWFTFDVIGKPTIFQVRIAFHYSTQHNTTYARILSLPINMTVNAGLQVQNLDALPLDIAQNGEYSFVLSLDVGNAWPKSLFYSCFVSDLGLKSAEPRRCHNHEGVLAPGQFQRVFMPIARPIALGDSDDDPESVRKALLERLRIIWRVEHEERMGEVDVSRLQMSIDALQTVAGEAICIELELADVEDKPPAGSKPYVKAGSFALLRAKLTNRSSQSYPLVVQLQSRTLNSSDSTISERQIAFAGTQNKFVPAMPGGACQTVEFAFCPLLSGLIELEAVARLAVPKQDPQPQWRNQAPWTSHKRFLLQVT